jgi:hypothetical protein
LIAPRTLPLSNDLQRLILSRSRVKTLPRSVHDNGYGIDHVHVHGNG